MRVNPERGASAIVVAISMLVIMGFAALVIDLGAGFNQRAQDQSAADAGVMAGALQASFLGETNTAIAQQVVDYVRSDVDATITDADWEACQDTGHLAQSLPAPWNPGITLQCVSRSASSIRVRVPNQEIATTFGKVLGESEIQTSAFAEATVDTGAGISPILPYGIAGGTGSGELCFGTSPSGTAIPPCSGPSSGTFGTLLSEFFGDFYGAVDCGNPGSVEIATASALGVDHFIDIWVDRTGVGVTPGDPHPGDTFVLNVLPETNRDACNDVGGVAEPDDAFPLNTVRVDSGFPSNAMESGLVSNDTFVGPDGVVFPSRLQQTSVAYHPGGAGKVANDTRTVVKKRAGANETLWELDNNGPWDYLNNNASAPPTCQTAAYTGLSTVDKIAKFNSCLSSYNSANGVIFDDLIATSPRFAWAPQYWYDLPTTGLSWEPVEQYRMVFIAGVYFNCSAVTCGVIFYPDADESSEMCDGSGGHCQELSLDQFSAWVLPDSAMPESIRGSFPGGPSPARPTLSK
jgi:hypothetical protein